MTLPRIRHHFYPAMPHEIPSLGLVGCLFCMFLFSETIHAQLFGPYRWKDSKGNCVSAVQGTIDDERPERRQLSLQTIRDDFLSGWWSNSTDKEYVRSLSEHEQEAFFRAIQRAIADTGKAEYRLRFPDSFTVHFGIPHGFDVIYPLNGPFEGYHCGG